MKVIDKSISELIHPKYNPRKISDNDFEHLKKSLIKYSSVEPAVINTHPGRENIIVGGNQRIRAAKDLGWDIFPCVEVSLDRSQEKELNVRLNRNTGEFDFDMLKEFFNSDELINWGFTEEEIKFGDEYDMDGVGYLDDDEKESMTITFYKHDADNIRSEIESVLNKYKGANIYG